MRPRRRVLVVGGGITGLSAALHLQESRAPLDIVLLEASNRLGGCIFTERTGGFVMEHGADVFVSRMPHAVALARTLDLELQEPLVQRALVRQKGGLVPLPEGFTGLVPGRLGPVMDSPLLSFRGKARLLLEWLIPARKEGSDESVEAFFVRRYGKEVYARMIGPLLGGLSGGDPANLSMDALLPHLRAIEEEHGSLLTGATRARGTQASHGFRSLYGGLGDLIAALQERIRRAATIRLGARIEAIQRTGNEFVATGSGGIAWRADAVVVTVPAYAAATMLEPLDGALAELLQGIHYGATIMVQTGYEVSPMPRFLEASGYVTTSDAGSLAVASTWSSAKFAHRAPQGCLLVRTVFGRQRGDAAFAMDDDELCSAARAEVAEVLGITAAPVITRVHRWHHSLPRYVMGHRARSDHITLHCRRHQGLYLAGAANHGAGIPSCIWDAQRAAQALLKDMFANYEAVQVGASI